MIPLTLADVARLTGGTVHPGTADPERIVVHGPVVTDSREAGPGSLFVARLGEHTDGHHFAPAAAAAGAVAVLGSRPIEALPCVVVDDVTLGFGHLARGLLAAAPTLDVVAITGSSGKTSTKDLLAHVLAAAGPTVAPVNSYNGEIGVPLTVCRIERDTRYLVLEMGARGPGHLRYLTGIASPHVAVVLNVGSAHLGEFGSVAAIAAAKSELVQDLSSRDVAVLNADDPAVAAMAEQTTAQVVTFGVGPVAQVRADDIRLDVLGRPSFTVHTASGTHPVALRLHGRHHVANALAVVAVAQALGLELSDVATALGEARPVSRWRMEVLDRPDGVTVVNDAYNANPESMRAALEALLAMAHPAGGPSRRSWAVLGEMLELGPGSAAAHRDLGATAARLGVDQLLAVGEGARPVAEGAREHPGSPRVAWVGDADAAYELLAEQLRAGDVVLLKSSRDSGLRWLGERLVDRQDGS